MINMKVIDKTLIISDNALVVFDYPIKMVFEDSEMFIVCLKIPSGAVFNENIYGVTKEGQISWEISKQYYLYESSNFRNIHKNEEGVWLVNWDGSQYLIDVITGEIKKRAYYK